MVEHSTMRVLHAPTLGWRNVNLREPLAAATGLPVQIENSGRACALAQVWAQRDNRATPGDLVFVSVSDGVGVGVIIQGELLRGRHNIAGEFGHVPLSLDGPRCSCGSNGCWEAYISNRATLARYFGRAAPVPEAGDAGPREFTIEDLIARAQGERRKGAWPRIEATARYLGLGLASVINAFDPARVYIGGEMTQRLGSHRAHRPRRARGACADSRRQQDRHPAGVGRGVPAPARRRRPGRGAGICRAGRRVMALGACRKGWTPRSLS